MASPISAYNTSKTGASAPKDITKTDVSGDKVALDVAIKEGNISGTFTPSGLTTGGKITEVTLASGSWTALPASALANRNGLGIQNETSIKIKVGYDSGEAGFVGWNVYPGGEFFIDLTDSVTVYAKSETGTPTITVMEVA